MGQPLAFGSLDRLRATLGIAQAALVVTEIDLAEVSLQVLLTDVLENASDVAAQQTFRELFQLSSVQSFGHL